jgi:hypothetical protein
VLIPAKPAKSDTLCLVALLVAVSFLFGSMGNVVEARTSHLRAIKPTTRKTSVSLGLKQERIVQLTIRGDTMGNITKITAISICVSLTLPVYSQTLTGGITESAGQTSSLRINRPAQSRPLVPEDCKYGQACELHVKRTDAREFVQWAGDRTSGFNLIRQAIKGEQ